jgi:hypothetical protein
MAWAAQKTPDARISVGLVLTLIFKNANMHLFMARKIIGNETVSTSSRPAVRWARGCGRTAWGFCLAALIGSLAADAQATQITAVSVAYPRGADFASFQIVFDQVPEFGTVDAFGRPADSFQLYVYPEATPPPVGRMPWDSIPWSSIIRGDEIHLGSGIPLRDASPAAADFAAHGWGDLRGSVDYALDGNLLSFQVPLGLLGVEGAFGYVVEGTEYGAMNTWLSDVVPVPESLPALFSLTLLLPFAMAYAFRRKATP